MTHRGSLQTGWDSKNMRMRHNSIAEKHDVRYGKLLRVSAAKIGRIGEKEKAEAAALRKLMVRAWHIQQLVKRAAGARSKREAAEKAGEAATKELARVERQHEIQIHR